MSPIWPIELFSVSIIRMMFVISQTQHGRVGDVGLWGWGDPSELDPTSNPEDTSKGCVSLKGYLIFL